MDGLNLYENSEIIIKYGVINSMNENQYSIFEKDILKDEKSILIIANLLSLILLCAGVSFLFIDNGIYVLIIFVIFAVLLTLISILQYIRYQTTIIIENEKIKVYSNNRYIRSFELNEIKIANKEVVIRMPSRGRKALISNCLIIYKDIEIYDMMEYRSYWNDKNILIIQNKQLIQVLNKII